MMAKEMVNKPPIFILWAEDNLNISIRRALQFTAKFLSSNYPQKFRDLNLHFDEIYLAFDILLQWSYLTRWNSSFTERFFSLQRVVSGSSAGTDSKLGKSAIFKSLLQLCIWPYVQHIVHRRYEKARDKHLINCDSGENVYQLTISERLLVQYYSWLQKLNQILRVYMWIVYVTRDDSNPHSVSLWLTNIVLRHSSANQNPKGTNLSSRISFYLSSLFDYTFRSGAFFIQFLEYWNSHTDLRRVFHIQNPQLAETESLWMSTKQIGLCPLCHKEWENPTALYSSGYVFCYRCIHEYLKSNRRCPVSGFPSDSQQLVRIFD